MQEDVYINGKKKVHDCSANRKRKKKVHSNLKTWV